MCSGYKGSRCPERVFKYANTISGPDDAHDRVYKWGL